MLSRMFHQKMPMENVEIPVIRYERDVGDFYRLIHEDMAIPWKKPKCVLRYVIEKNEDFAVLDKIIPLGQSILFTDNV